MTPGTRRRKAVALWSGSVLLLGATTLGLMQMYVATAAPDNCGNCQGNGGGGGSPGKAITVSGVAVTPIAPGRAGTVTVTVRNPNNQDVLVTRVSGSVTRVTSPSGTSVPTCLDSWFILGAIDQSRLITRNTTGTVTLPVRFKNEPEINQDDCKNVRYNFSFTVFGQQA